MRLAARRDDEMKILASVNAEQFFFELRYDNVTPAQFQQQRLRAARMQEYVLRASFAYCLLPDSRHVE